MRIGRAAAPRRRRASCLLVLYWSMKAGSSSLHEVDSRRLQAFNRRWLAVVHPSTWSCFFAYRQGLYEPAAIFLLSPLSDVTRAVMPFRVLWVVGLTVTALQKQKNQRSAMILTCQVLLQTRTPQKSGKPKLAALAFVLRTRSRR